MTLQRLPAGDHLFDTLTGVELTADNPARVSAQTGGAPTDIPLTNVALGTSAEHVVIHDLHNVSWWAWRPGTTQDARLYDVTVYNVGWQGRADKDRPDGGHGQALYTQNYLSGGKRTIDTCVFVAGFSLPGKIYGTNSEISPGGWVLHATTRQTDDGATVYDLQAAPGDPSAAQPWDYTSPRNKLANFDILRSIFAGARCIIGNEGKSPWGAHNIHIHDCAFQARLQFGYQGYNGDGSITDSLLTSGVSVQCQLPDHAALAANLDIDGAPLERRTSWRDLTFANNVVIAEQDGAIAVMQPGAAWAWDYNLYWTTVAKPFALTRLMGFARDTNGYPRAIVERRSLTFAEWQETTGFDAHSECRQTLPESDLERAYPVLFERDGVEYVGAHNIAAWASGGAGMRDSGVLYPPPNPVNFDGPALAMKTPDPRFAIWREAETEDEGALRIAELEATVAALSADLETVMAEKGRLEATIAENAELLDAARNLWAASERYARAVTT